ncbi:MAG: ANTAR domain-containing response regulator [Eubacterium sp.]
MPNIVIAFSGPNDGRAIKSLLTRNGYDVLAVCTSGAQAISMLDGLNDGLVICGYKMTDMLYSELRGNLSDTFEMIVIASAERIMDIAGSGIVGLETPLKVRDMMNTTEMLLESLAIKRRKRRREIKQRNPEEKAIIQQAKEVLMEKNNLTENEAHRYIQKTSMDSGNNMVETARMILSIMYRE